MKKVVIEIDSTDKMEAIINAATADHSLYCVKLRVNQNITSMAFKEEWQGIPLVIYPSGLGWVRDLIGWLPVLKKLNVKFFMDSSVAQSYEAVQILSSLGLYSGIVINEHADWEKLTDLMYYALCGKVAHAPIEPFQYVYDMYKRNTLVDYGTVYFENPAEFCVLCDAVFKKNRQHRDPKSTEKHSKSWQKFFYEATPCAACAGWRICMGKYARLENKTKCAQFTSEWLKIIETLKP